MAPNRRKVVGSRHLVCDNCAIWIQHDNSGCEKKWADTRDEGFLFTCKGCTEVAKKSGKSEADGGRHEGDGCRTALLGQRSRNGEQSDDDRSKAG